MFYDSVELRGQPQLTKDGYLVATARVARTGIQLYTGDELGKPDMPVVRVYRPESSVFDTRSLHSFAYRPMTNDHPAEPVTAASWKRDAIGQAGGEVMRDGDHIRVPLIMMDAAAIADYNAGKRELSVGYEADLDWTPGITDSGEEYDAIQTNIRANHIALVDKGRAGTARIGDKSGQPNSSTTAKKEAAMATRKVKVGDVSIEVDEQAAEVITALAEKLKAAEEKASAATEAAQAEADAKDKELAAKDAEIAKLKADTMTADKLDAAIADRVALITKAKAVADVDYAGLDATGIKRKAVEAIRGDGSMKDKSAAYIDAAFDLIDAKPATQHRDSQVADFQAAYEEKLTKAWSK